MKIPYVIDNQTHSLADILNALLVEHKGRSLDVATAYFTVGGFGLLKEGLFGLGNLRLLLGAEPTSGEQLGLRPHPGNITGLIRQNLEPCPSTRKPSGWWKICSPTCGAMRSWCACTTRDFYTPLVNYDLHWNPTRMVQRAGRIDRIGTDFDTLWIYNMFPDEGLERLLGLVESLSRKIADIDRAGFLDASVLGKTVHPQNFNTLRRIRDENGSVIDEEEQFTELASSEFLVQQLRALMDAGGREMLESLPDGIHSGLARAGAKGVFFYFQADASPGGKQHFWKYCDLYFADCVDHLK